MTWRWTHRLLNKAKTMEIVNKYKFGLFVEVERGAKPGYHLKANTDKGIMIVGRVSKNIFKWFDLVECDDQPEFINIRWWKFKQ